MNRASTAAATAPEAAVPPVCPVCGGRRLVGLGGRARTLCRCRDCGLLFQPSRPGESRTQYDEGYFALRSGGDQEMVGALRRRTFEHHLAIIERSGIEGRGTLVDVGCGEGFLLRVAHERGWSALYGVDVSPAAGTEAAGLATIHHGLLSTAPFPAGIADVVTFFDSFEHIWDPLPELLAARRLLKPRGILYLVTPDAGGLFARVMGRRWFQIKPDEHLRLYTRGALRAALAPAGWNAISFRQGWKHTTMAFVTTILGTTNPALARVLRGTLGWSPIWRRVLPLPSGDLVVLGMQGASAGAVRERSETA